MSQNIDTRFNYENCVGILVIKSQLANSVIGIKKKKKQITRDHQLNSKFKRKMKTKKDT